MRAFILAAGEGKRMQPLTHSTPKPLLKVGGRALLEWHLLALRDAGITNIVINVAYLGQQIIDFCGDGSRWGVSIDVSPELQPLETAGGIINALGLLGTAPFLLISADIYCPFPFHTLTQRALPKGAAHIVLVENPAHNPRGDFQLAHDRVTTLPAFDTQAATAPQATQSAQTHATRDPLGKALTYSGIGIYDPQFFAPFQPGFQPLRPFMESACLNGRLSGEQWSGVWEDVGTPQRLEQLNQQLAAQR